MCGWVKLSLLVGQGSLMPRERERGRQAEKSMVLLVMRQQKSSEGRHLIMPFPVNSLLYSAASTGWLAEPVFTVSHNNKRREC